MNEKGAREVRIEVASSEEGVGWGRLLAAAVMVCIMRKRGEKGCGERKV